MGVDWPQGRSSVFKCLENVPSPQAESPVLVGSYPVNPHSCWLKSRLSFLLRSKFSLVGSSLVKIWVKIQV